MAPHVECRRQTASLTLLQQPHRRNNMMLARASDGVNAWRAECVSCKRPLLPAFVTPLLKVVKHHVLVAGDRNHSLASGQHMKY